VTTWTGARREHVALAVALVWGAGLLVGAALAPAYEMGTATSTGVVVHGSATLVEENGPGVMLVVAVPLVAAAIVGLVLGRRRAMRGAGPVAWTCAGLLAGFNLLALASIGLFILPVTVCLLVACATRQAHGRVPPGETAAHLT
jgi:hypothetical protein